MSELIARTKNIQRHYGLKVDGVWGPRSAAAVWAGICGEGVNQEDVGDEGGGDAGWRDGLDGRTVKNIESLDEKARGMFADFSRLAAGTAATPTARCRSPPTPAAFRSPRPSA